MTSQDEQIYLLLDIADTELKQSDEIWNYYEEHGGLGFGLKMLITALRNLLFFDSLSIINSLLRGTSDEYTFEKLKYKHVKELFEMKNLHLIRNKIADHKGKDAEATEKRPAFRSGDLLNGYINRVAKVHSDNLRQVVNEIISIAGIFPRNYSNAVKIDWLSVVNNYQEKS